MKLIKTNEPWLAATPADWTSSRIRNVAQLSPGYSGRPPRPGELCAVVPMELLSESGVIDTSFLQAFEDVTSGLTLFEVGDVLFAKITPCMENGKGALVNSLQTRYAFGSTEFHVLRPSYAINARFLYYYTFNPIFRAYAAENMSGAAGQKRVSSRFLKETRLYLPPLPEQARIAAYLDASCAAIDAAVAAKRRQIEVLDGLRKTIIHTAVTRGLDETAQMKDSGHEWLGQFPVNWRIVAIKRIVATKITDGPHETPELLDDGVQFISAEAIKNNQIDFNLRRGFISQELHEQYCRKCKPQRGDIFVIKSGATTGNVAYVNVDFEFSIWSPLAVIRCDDRIAFYKFIYYVLLTDVFRKQVELSWSFGTQQNIGMRVIERIRVPIPPVTEQREIAAFLDEETSKIEGMKANIEAQIATLLAYRKSLIHECVTGGRRVSAADVAQAEAGRPRIPHE